ncbi:MAG: tyrosine-type recombinase/integrase [Clostridia bacterium]|nr:tyrosine-type recombinase/integrase [Clostridia bacterium]
MHVPGKLRLKKTGRKADKDGFLEILSDRCGIPNLHPHKLRHTFASIAITNGGDAASVSETLGHSDKAVTLRMYTHANEESKRKVNNLVEELLK